MSNNDGQFDNAKNTVLSYCSSTQTSLGALLIGYAVALFTLFELFKDLGRGGLANSFQLGIKIEAINSLIGNSYVKLGLLFIGALLITTYIVRTVHRYASYSGLYNCVMYMEPPLEKIKGMSLQYAILKKAYGEMKREGRRAFLLPFNYFFTGEEVEGTGKEKRKGTFYGWMLSVIIAVFLVVGLLILLW